MSLVFGIIVLVLLLGGLTLWFFMMPRVTGGADLSLLKKNYAHRGLWDAKFPPSSLDAILLASRVDYGVKIEVYASRDRRLMVVGKPSLPLSLVLATLNGAAPLMIEIGGKKKTDLGLCLRLARMLDAYEGAFSIVSSDPKMLAYFKDYRPGFARGQIVASHSGFAASHLLLNYRSRPDFLVIEKSVRHRTVPLLLTKLCHLPCFIYPIDSLEDYRACRRKKQYAIFTNIRPKDRPKKGKRHGQFYV